MAARDAREDVGEIGLRVNAVQLTSLDQRSEDGPMLAAAIRSGEERVLAIEGDRPDGALDDVGVDLDPAVIEEANKAIPATEAVANGLGDRALPGNGGELAFQPGLELDGDEISYRLHRPLTSSARRSALEAKPLGGFRATSLP
jgi:hypothetical protein